MKSSQKMIYRAPVPTPPGVYADGTLTLRYEAWFRGRMLDLSYEEFKILRALAQTQRPMTYGELMQQLAGNPSKELVDLHVNSLRRKMGEDPEKPSFILSVDEGSFVYKSQQTEPVSLTPRELQILQLINKGIRQKEIATKLNITRATVKAHISNIARKFGVFGGFEVLSRAREYGLL